MALSNTNIKMQEVDKLVNNKSTSTNVKLRELCSSLNINPWSKMKPMAIKLADAASNGYGIELLSSNTPIGLWNAVKDNGFKGYRLKNVITGTSTNVRLGDFRNYDNTNMPPIANLYESGVTIDLSALPNIANKQYERDVEGNDMTSSTTLICRDDLVDYSKLNRGVLFIKYNGGESYTPECWCVSSIPIPKAYCDDYYDENGELLYIYNESMINWNPVTKGFIPDSQNYCVMEFMTSAPENTFSTNPSGRDPNGNPYTFIATPNATHPIYLIASKSIQFTPKDNYAYVGASKASYSFDIQKEEGVNGKVVISNFNITLYQMGRADALWRHIRSNTTIPEGGGGVIIDGMTDDINNYTFSSDHGYYFIVEYDYAINGYNSIHRHHRVDIQIKTLEDITTFTGSAYFVYKVGPQNPSSIDYSYTISAANNYWEFFEKIELTNISMQVLSSGTPVIGLVLPIIASATLSKNNPNFIVNHGSIDLSNYTAIISNPQLEISYFVGDVLNTEYINITNQGGVEVPVV